MVRFTSGFVRTKRRLMRLRPEQQSGSLFGGGWRSRQPRLVFQRPLHLTDLYSSFNLPRAVIGLCFMLDFAGDYAALYTVHSP